MDHRDIERTGRNLMAGLLMGIFVFFAGVFINIASWGFYSFLGIPLMLFGVAIPFIEMWMAKNGKTWIGRNRPRPGFMNRGEAERLNDSLRSRQRTTRAS